MKRTALSIVGALLLFGVTPAFAKEDCIAGYKDFLGKMSTHISKMSGDELASYIRESLGAYDFVHVWRQLLAARRVGPDTGRYGQVSSLGSNLAGSLVLAGGSPLLQSDRGSRFRRRCLSS